MRDQQLALMLAFMLPFTSGCRKDKDDSPPSLSILLPGEAHILSIPDTLVVRVEVSDDRVVKSIYIALADINGVPVTAPITTDVGTTSAIITRDLIVTDESIASGSYTLTVRATDGTNERRAFRSIVVNAAPLRLRSVFIAPPAGSSPALITRIDSTGSLSSWGEVTDINGAAVSSASQHIYISGGQTAALTAMATASTSTTWQVPNLNGAGVPYFTGLRMDPLDGRLYFGTNEGFIRGYTGSGNQTFTSAIMAGYRSDATVVVGDRLISAQRGVAVPDKYLVGFAYASGQQLVQFPLDLDVVSMDRRTDQHVLLIGNRDGQGVVQDRNVYQGGTFEMRVFDEGPIAAALRLDAQTWVLALPKRLVRFNHGSNSATTLAAGWAAGALAYDAATGVLYAGNGNLLLLLDPNTGSTATSFSMPTEVGFILPLLNR